MSDKKLRDLGYTIAKPKGGRVIVGGPALAAFVRSRAAAAVVPFDPTKHPRHPAGVREGGRFAPKGGGPETERERNNRLWDEAAKEIVDTSPPLQMPGNSSNGMVTWTNAAPTLTKIRLAEDLGEALAGDEDFIALGHDLGDIVNQPVGWVYTKEQWAALPFEQRTAAHLIDRWSITSGDHNPLALAMQRAAVQEFGLSDVDDFYLSDRPGGVDTWPVGPPPLSEAGERGARKFLRAQYDGTQRWFADRGVEELTLYRGSRAPSGSSLPEGFPRPGASAEPITFRSNPLSSYSHSADHARYYTWDPDGPSTGAIVSQHVPVSRVMATPFTGYGAMGQLEYVVLGGESQGKVWTFDSGDDLPSVEEIRRESERP